MRILLGLRASVAQWFKANGIIYHGDTEARSLESMG
jgi:hypothetical protein